MTKTARVVSFFPVFQLLMIIGSFYLLINAIYAFQLHANINTGQKTYVITMLKIILNFSYG